MDRRQQQLRMTDLVQHLGQACEQWLEARGPAARYLAQSIDRQLTELRSLLAPQESPSAERPIT
jgi:hypothetical protein